MAIHFTKKAQVKALLFDKVSTIVLVEYFNYNNIFLTKNTVNFQNTPK